MGQRLNVELYANNELLTNCYFHWSGYTDNACVITQDILNIHEYHKEIPLDKDYAIFLFESIGAGREDRSDGLISLTDEEVQCTRDAEEARVTIYLDKREVDFDVLWDLSDWEDDELKYYDTEHPDCVVDIPTFPLMNFEDFFDFSEEILHNNICLIQKKSTGDLFAVIA